MSTDNSTPTTQSPQAPAIVPSGAPATQPNAGPGGNGGQALNTPAPQPQGPALPQQDTPAAPYRTFNTQEELDGFFADRAKRAQRSAIRELAKEFGFEDVDELRDAIGAIRGPRNGGAANNGGGNQPGGQNNAQAQPGAPAAPDLQTLLRVAAKYNVPAALIGRLSGATEQELEQDAQTLLAAIPGAAAHAAPSSPNSQQARQPGIPAADNSNQPVTITRSWMRDNPAWVRANRALVDEAQRTGRIVDS